MRRLLPAFVLLLGGTLSCFAQTSVLPVFRNPTGSGTTEVSAANPLPVNASVSVSASISGFHQESVLTPLSVTVANTTSGAFTAAKTIIVANAGSTNTAYCALGNTATTSGQPVPPQSWVAFTSTVETTVSCITASSTTTVNVSVGSGLPTGAGGGAGGGGGGAITAASSSYAAGALSAGAGVDGWDLTQGAKADAACGSDNGTCSVAALLKRGNQNLTTLNTTAGGSIPAQSSHGVNIGAVEGQTASGVTPTENPLYAGGLARTTNPTAVADGQKVPAEFDSTGKQVTSPYAIRESYVRGSVSGTDNAAHTIIGAQGASVKTYITDLECGRSDAGTTAITLTLSDAAATILVLPNNGGGGGNNKTFNVPLVTAANTAFTFTASTGTTTVYCSAQGYIGY